MKIIGIIAEYDPFHNGHLYHIKKAKEMTGADAAVIVMSGHFTQRGMPSFFSRESRTRMAVEGGADLVIELPYIYACNSSHEFAHGAVGILNGLGFVDTLVFGAETDNMNMLKQAADAASGRDGELDASVKKWLKTGLSYPESLTRAVEETRGHDVAEILRSPNNLLAVEYLKALAEFDSAIEPAVVKRKGAAHGGGKIIENTAVVTSMHENNNDRRQNDLENGIKIWKTSKENIPVNCIVSGTEARCAVYEGGTAVAAQIVPNSSLEAISEEERRLEKEIKKYGYTVNNEANGSKIYQESGNFPNAYSCSWNTVKSRMFELIKYRIMTSSADELADVYGVGEGLENRLKACINEVSDIDGLIDAVRSRRYTRARTSRMVAHILMNLKTADFEQMRGIFYARVLGFSKTGAKLLRTAAKTSEIPVISNLSRLKQRDDALTHCLAVDMLASDICAMLRGSAETGAEKKFVPYRKL